MEGEKDMYNPERHALEKVMVSGVKWSFIKARELRTNKKLLSHGTENRLRKLRSTRNNPQAVHVAYLDLRFTSIK